MIIHIKIFMKIQHLLMLEKKYMTFLKALI